MPLTSAQQIAIDRAKLEAALADPLIVDKRHIYQQLQDLPATTTTTTGSGASDVSAGIDGSADIEAIKSLINDIKAELTNTAAIADLLIQDSSATPRYFIRQDKIDQTTGLPSVAIVNFDNSVPNPAPVLPLSPVKAGSSNLINEDIYVSIAAGTGYTAGDSIANCRLLNGETGLVVVSSWYNITTRSSIATAPPIAHLKGYEDKLEELLTGILNLETSNNTALVELGNNSDVSIPTTNLDPATIKGLLRYLALRVNIASSNQTIGDIVDISIPTTVNDTASVKGLLRFLTTKIISGITVAAARKTEIAGIAMVGTANVNLLDPANTNAATDVRDYRSMSVTIERTGVIGTTNYIVTSALDAGFTRGVTQLDTIWADGTIRSGAFSTTINTIVFSVDVCTSAYIKVARTGSTSGQDRATALLSQLPINARVAASLPATTAVASVGTVGSAQLASVGAAVVDTFFTTLNTGTTTSVGTGVVWGIAQIFEFNVTAYSGSGTLNVIVQESLDGANNWRTVYTFSPITASGVYSSPPVTTAGKFYQYVQTVVGAGATFSRGVNRYPSNLNVAAAAAAALGDDLANPTIGIVGAAGLGYNGVTWDRIRAGISGAAASVLGYLNTIGVGKYNATPPTLTDGQWLETQIDRNGQAKITGSGFESSATLTRAANTTAYSINDVYGTFFELPNFGLNGGFVILSSVKIVFNIATLPAGMGPFLLFLYSAAPPSGVIDNNAFSVPATPNDRAINLTPGGGIPIGNAVLEPGGGSVGLTANNLNVQIKLDAGKTSVWGYLVTLAAFTPAAASETAKLTTSTMGV